MAAPRPQPETQPVARVGRSSAEIALVERLLSAARGGADVRARKVRRLRAAIRVKVYENDLKLAVAVENLLSAIAPAEGNSPGPSISPCD
jgi:hypothetical protein